MFFLFIVIVCVYWVAYCSQRTNVKEAMFLCQQSVDEEWMRYIE